MAKSFNPRGRPKGSKNKWTEELHEIAQRLGVNPVEILLRFAAGDWKGLGYSSPTEIRYTMDGKPYEVDKIEVKERVRAAADAAPYLFPKRKSVEHSGPDGQALFGTLADLVKAASEKK